MANDNDNLVVAYFENKAAAEKAADGLKQWDKADDDIKLGAIGVITLDKQSGKINVDEIGQRNVKSGALWGTAIGAAAGLLTAGLALIPGAIIGAAVGGGIGALDHKSLGMSDEDVQNMAAKLRDGGVALGVMCDGFEVDATTAKLSDLGGSAEHFSVQDEAAEAITSAAAAQKAATSAIEESVSESAEDVAKAVDAARVEMPDLDEHKAATVGGLAAAGGFAAAQASSLSDAGVSSASDLLQLGATPAGRSELASASGLDDEVILTGVKRLDLMRVTGVGTNYAHLLLLSGVETVPDLARRNASNLAETMDKVNAAESVTQTVPSETQVEAWVLEAKSLPRIIMY
ncbi:MAG: DUF4332 domain-containing protein [Candidatus Promineifilaceae bacterium]